MTIGESLNRRAFLAGLLATSAGARAEAPKRLIALDWGWASTALALGLTPAGVAEQRLYREWVRDPALPDDVAEVGLRIDPSLETLAALKPDLILTNSLHANLDQRLQRIAPTLVNPTFAENRAPLANAGLAARLLAQDLGRPERATALIGSSADRIARARDRLASSSGRAFLPLSVIDRRHLTVYGDGSLFVDTLRALGLRGLWSGPTSLWGHKAATPPDLAGLPPGDLLIIDPLPPAGVAMLDPSGLLARLCAAEGRAIHRLPAAWGFGDITAAALFAEQLAGALGPPA